MKTSCAVTEIVISQAKLGKPGFRLMLIFFVGAVRFRISME